MPGPTVKRADDERILSILHDIDPDGGGLSFSEASAKRRGLTRFAVAGIKKRTVGAADAIPCECVKPENMDGAMGPKWWRR